MNAFLNDILDKATTKLNEFKEYNEKLKNGQTIALSEDKINMFIALDKAYLSNLSDNGIKTLKITIKNDKLILSGRFESKVDGDFYIEALPKKVIWDDEKHAIYFQLTKKGVSLNNKILDVLLQSLNVVMKNLFGQDMIDIKFSGILVDDLYELNLDKDSKLLKRLFAVFSVSKVYCEDDCVKCIVKLHSEKIEADNMGIITALVKEHGLNVFNKPERSEK